MEISKETQEAIERVGGEDAAVAFLLKLKAERKLRGTVTSAGLALPEEIVEWSGGTVGITVNDSGHILVDRVGDMKLTCRPNSRQGVAQHGWLKWRLLKVGYGLKDKVKFRHDDDADVYFGEKV